MVGPAFSRGGLILVIDALVAAGLFGAVAAGVMLLAGGSVPRVDPAAATATATSTTAAPVTAPVTVTVPIRRAPLTGLPLDDASWATVSTRRTLVVKIDDAPQVSAHPGLEQADLVDEVLVEGGLTRYLAIFGSQVPPRVGPVRSVRTTDFALTGNLGVPILAYSGGNQRTVAEVLRLPVIPFSPEVADGDVYSRDRSLRPPHNLFLRPEAMWQRVLGTATPVSPFSNTRTDDPLTSGTASMGVRLSFSKVTDSTFVWDSASGRYLRYQRGVRQVDGAGKTLGFDVVVVLNTDYGISPYDSHSPEAWTVGSGSGLLLNHGQVLSISWKRTDRTLPFTLGGPDGAPVELPVGRGWVAFVPNSGGSAVTVDPGEAASLLEGP